MSALDHGVTDDDGNLLLGQRGDGSPIWNDPEDPLPLRRVAHFTEQDARCKAWELAGAGYGPTGISKLHHSGLPSGVGEAPAFYPCSFCKSPDACRERGCADAAIGREIAARGVDLPVEANPSEREALRGLVAALREYASFPPKVLPALLAAERALGVAPTGGDHGL